MFKILNLILILVFFTYAFEPLYDSEMDYTIYLPENWVRTVITPELHRFHDTTGTYQSQITIEKHSFSSADYTDAKEWVNVNYIAYEFSAIYSSNPVGTILFADSSSELKHGEYDAAELYARFCYLDDPLVWWDEYIRFAAAEGDTVGFEMYVMGDTADMFSNIGLYATIIENTDLPAISPSNVRFSAPGSYGREKVNRSAPSVFNLQGRRIGISKRQRNIPAGMYLHNRSRAKGETMLHLKTNNKTLEPAMQGR
ncbi:hypothetical protein QA601_17965 [Chitinispirillales bacterium ANBcel5]|uniref:hypothetical protein n=1 Tax=Cellulosispirillum alkaliphilum TaxID=3039283 RepID=UPI002A59692B|nr:hypothetical protein [Chitinispirillales bacterium ANBcel5]